MKRRREAEPRGALSLLDRSVHLLRRAGAATLATWLLGSGPFVVAALFFWADMAHSPFAQRHLAAASLGMALLFVWMKTWQAVFASRLRALAGNRKPERLGWRGWLETASVQTRWHSTAFVVLPLAALVALPFAWVYAFYHSLTATRSPREARSQAMRWPRQNHVLIVTLSAFSLFVFLNVLIALIALPSLLQTLFAIETPMSRSPWSMANSTTLALAVGLSYLALGPLVRAAYVLRCFDGDSLISGEDLLVELVDLERERR